MPKRKLVGGPSAKTTREEVERLTQETDEIVRRARVRLSEIRRARYQSTRDAAKDLGIGSSTAHRIENVNGIARDRTYDPPLSVVLKLLKRCEVRFSEFFGTLDAPPRSDVSTHLLEGDKKRDVLISPEVVAHESRPSLSSPDEFGVLLDTLADVGTSLYESIARIQEHRQSRAAAPRGPSGRGARAAGHD